MFDLSHFRPGEIRGLSRDDYARLLDVDAFGDEKVELLYGQLVKIPRPGEQDCRITAWFHQVLLRAPAFDVKRFEVRGQSPLVATEDSVPQPDIQVIDRGRLRRSRAAALVIEVSVTSRHRDHVIKPRLYAVGDVPEYWIVNAKARTIDVLTQPSPTGYQQRTTLRIGDVLAPFELPGIEIPVAGVPWLPIDDDDPGDDD